MIGGARRDNHNFINLSSERPKKKKTTKKIMLCRGDRNICTHHLHLLFDFSILVHEIGIGSPIKYACDL